MIRVYVTQDNDRERDGGLSLAICGHAGVEVCAATTAAWNGFIGQIEWMASRYPSQIKLVQTYTVGEDAEVEVTGGRKPKAKPRGR